MISANSCTYAVDVAERVRTEQRRRVDKVDDDKFNVPAHLFAVGDYILRSIPGDTAERHQRGKLRPVKVPMQVVMALSPSAYMCRDLATRALRLLHGQHMQLYAGRGTIISWSRHVMTVHRWGTSPTSLPSLLAHYCTPIRIQAPASEWISWSEIKKQHSVVKDLKQLALQGGECVARRGCRRTTLLAHRVNTAEAGYDPNN
jgi:hypothetical protein